MEHLDPYDRQPFSQLEETFRRTGEDRLANDVYFKRKRRESARIKLRNPVAWLKDRFLWLITGYGVRLKYLSVTIALTLLVGTLIFHFEGAVEPRLDKQQSHAVCLQANLERKTSLPYFEAFWISLNLFLPVKIPSGAYWKPSSQVWVFKTKCGTLGIKFTTFATVLKLVGWILVPLGVAGLSGILKR